MGRDRHGKCFDHRKTWLVARIKYLTEVFAIDVAAYAVMSNHYHLVLHVDQSRAHAWSDEEVCRRWARLCTGPDELQRFIRGEVLNNIESELLTSAIPRWRALLCNLSRFMACLNYVIALRANKEDDCTGRFWEGRFKSQALKDDAALLACMAYVDLNPVRAGLAENLSDSEFTSIQDRILRAKRKNPQHPAPGLMPFAETSKDYDKRPMVPFSYRGYLVLVDWAGRIKHPNKRGVIKAKEPALLEKLGLSPEHWRRLELEIAKEASTMLNGLEFAERLSQRTNKKVA